MFGTALKLGKLENKRRKSITRGSREGKKITTITKIKSGETVVLKKIYLGGTTRGGWGKIVHTVPCFTYTTGKGGGGGEKAEATLQRRKCGLLLPQVPTCGKSQSCGSNTGKGIDQKTFHG